MQGTNAVIAISKVYRGRWTVRLQGSAVSYVFGSLPEAVEHCKNLSIKYEVQRAQ